MWASNLTRLSGVRLIMGLGAVLGVLFSGATEAQGGYSKEDFTRYGLEDFPVPRRWVAIPVQPTEKHVVLSWAEELPGEKDRRKARRYRPTLDLISLDVVKDPERSEAETTSTKNNLSRDLPVTSADRYLAKLAGKGRWVKEGSTEVLEEKAGRQRIIRRFNLERKGKNSRGSSPVAWTFEWRTPDHLWFLLGRCAPEDADAMIKIWRTMATKAKLVEPREPDLSKWARYYERHPKLKDPEFRMDVRSRLADVKGWKAEDTENYLIVYSTKDKALIRVLKRELEAIRRAYEEIFPPDRPLNQVSVLRVCKDKAEYHAYGGPERSGGYWSSSAEELVFYDYEDDRQKRGSGKANSRVVLYHEAFHQYVYYAAGDLAPHSWFNEGTGDFFSGARFDSTGSVSAIGPSPWRIDAIIHYAEQGSWTPLEDLLKASQAEYYANGSLNYAEGWALVYFLRTSRAAAKHPQWAKIHPTYYETLKSEWAKRRTELEESGQDSDPVAYRTAQEEARASALEAALANVNVSDLEQALIKFILDLKS